LSEEIKNKINKIKNKTQEQITIEREVTKLSTELKIKQLDAEKLKREKKFDDSELRNEIELLGAEVITKIGNIQQIRTQVLLQTNQLYTAFWTDPKKAIETFDDKTPIILFPIRLEIKYRYSEDDEDGKKYSLFVRIFPDDIAIQTHEPDITLEERDRLREYYDKISAPKENDFTDDDDEDAYDKALANYLSKKNEIIKNEWRILAEEFDPYRTSYLLKIDESSLEDDKDFRIGTEILHLRPDSWSEPPKSYIMPDKFIIKLFRDDSLKHEKAGNLIPNPLIVGPSPREIPEDGDVEYTLDADSEWLFDFEKAEEIGMAVKIPIKDIDAEKGFTKIIALGIKASTSEETSKTLLEELIKNHEYTENCSLLKIGTPTNNSGEDQSSFSTHDFGHDKAYELKNIEPAEYGGKDGSRLANALGLEEKIFSHLENAQNSDNLDAGHMQNALWGATFGYYLKYMLTSQSEVDETWNKFVEAFKKHFVKLVRARGPYSSIRIGSMPYGILPITAFENWKNNKQDSKIISEDVTIIQDDEKFNDLFLKWIQNFWEKWQNMAKNKDKVPYIGAYNDVERELVSILGIEAVSNRCKIRTVVSDYYIWNFLHFATPSLAKSGSTLIDIPFHVNIPQLQNSFSTPDLVSAWWDVAIKNHLETKAILDELGFPTNPEPTIASIQHWGESRYLKPRVYDEILPKTEQLPLMELADGTNPNYISWLEKKYVPLSMVHEIGWANPNSILYDLLKFSILLSDSKENESLKHLATSSIGSLEYLLSETLDLCTSRLDAFMTSLPHKRLESIRKDHSGIQIGAYGWLENLPPYSNEPQRGGFIHAPSISHAATAGVLRNAYLTHAGQDNAEVMSINFSSDRVRRALWYLDAVREGQPLAVLLGYQFERGLHENHLEEGLELDQYINPLRELYPIQQNETEVDPTGAIDAISARNVVDGLKLLTEWKNDNIPFSDSDNLPKKNSNEYNAIIHELELLDDSLDAVGDTALTESVFQYIEGNHDKAGALIEALSGGGTLPEPDVVKTPRGGISQEYKVMMLFNKPANDPPNWNLTPRAKIEPRLNQFAAKILGDPEKIVCNIEYDGINEELTLKEIMGEAVDGGEYMSISPLDFILMATSLPQGEATEIEQRISYYVRKKYEFSKDKEIKINFKQSQASDSENTSLLNLLEIARRMLDVIGNSVPIQPDDLHLPEESEDIVDADIETETEENRNQIIVGFDELQINIPKVVSEDYDGSLLKLRQGLMGTGENDGLIKEIQNAIQNNQTDTQAYLDKLEEIRATLFEISRFGITEAIPNSAIDSDKITVKDDLIRRAEAVVTEIDKRKKEYFENMGKINLEGFTIREKISFIINATKALFGKSFTVMPKIIPKNKDELAAAFAHPTDTSEYSSKLWLQQVSITHKQLKKFETFTMYVKSITTEINFDPKIAQLPYKEDGRWMGLPFENDDEKPQGTISLVTFDQNEEISFVEGIYGIILDGWLEMIPNKEETTGLAYHFNQPNSEPPQTILLSISPELEEGGKWKWSNLENSILDTLKLAKIRAIDYDALQGMGDMLPGLYLPTNPVETRETPRIIPIEHPGMARANTGDDD